MATDEFADLYLGEILDGRYEVQGFLGAGGFCLVYEAHDRVTDTQVAVKVLKPAADGDAVVEFETEGILLDRLRNRSHVLNLLGAASNKATIVVQKPGMPTPFPLPVSYLVVELADACLVDLVANRNDLPWADRLALFRDVVLGVHQMHLDAIVHRDLKSENALVKVSGNSVQACVADLGRGRDTRESARFLVDDYVAGRGDLRFAPPELLHLAGAEDPILFRRADVFLVGSAFYELCTGQGITSMVYGNPRGVLQHAVNTDPARRRNDYFARLAEHRARFEPAFQVAEHELPGCIRFEGSALLRQLCDPDPSARERRTRADGHQRPWGLEWLLRRVDILRKREAVNRIQAQRKRQVG